MHSKRSVSIWFCVLLSKYSSALGNKDSAYISYGDIFPPLDPLIVPKRSAKNSTVVTLCELWEDDGIPVTPGIDLALQRIAPHFALQNITFRLLRRLIPNGCSDASVLAVGPALVDMHLHDSPNGCHLLIGPSCSETTSNIRGLIEKWNIPVVTSGASGIKFDDKKKTDVLTRFGYTQEDVSLFLIRVLDHFNWTDVVFLYDVDSYANDFQTSFQQVLQISRMDLYRKIEFTKVMLGSSMDKQWLKDMLMRSSYRTRIFVLAALPRDVYQVMIVAAELGMLNSEYAYITTNLIETKAHGFSDLSFFKNKAKNDPEASRILGSLLVIRMKLPADDLVHKAEYEQFADAVKANSPQYNFTYAPGEQVTHLVLGIWDAVMLYGAALNATLAFSGDVRDGRAITSRIWGHSFHGVVIECTISEYGDRNFPYYLEDFSEPEGIFWVRAREDKLIYLRKPKLIDELQQPVLQFDSERNALTNVSSRRIEWPGGSFNPPQNYPVCGYSGKSGPCFQNGLGLPAYATVIIAVAGVVLATILASFLFYRWKLQLVDNDNSWKILSSEIQTRDKKDYCGSSSTVGARSQAGETISHSSRARVSRVSGASYVKTAYYKEMAVAVKSLEYSGAHITPQHIFELRALKHMVHDHIARFYGLCQDSTSPCIITECCVKGSLTDLLDNDAFNLDWPFKFALLNDTMKGVVFIHNSALKSHGRLMSNNCLIDGRFTLKIGDLGLTALRPSTAELATCNVERLAAHLQANHPLLWRAPEHLRTQMPSNGTAKGDIYSFGIVMQQVVLRAGPYERRDGHRIDSYDVVCRVRDLTVPPFRPRVPHDLCPPELHSIMLRCWSENPVDRPEAERAQTLLKQAPGNKHGNLMEDLMNRMEKYANDLEQKVNERTAEFVDEKKRAEDLLYQMLPNLVANKLKQGQFVEPEILNLITVSFINVDGFTILCQNSGAMQVVDMLNSLYTLFDGVIEKHDIYKVDVNLDAYMVVSGITHQVSKASGLHAVEICHMAVSLVSDIQAFKIKHRSDEEVRLRIGVHSGPAIAGVVGVQMPKYCIFGECVGIAAKVEATCEAKRIHISLITKRALNGCDKEFLLDLHKQIDLKGGGTMMTYWLRSAVDKECYRL